MIDQYGNAVHVDNDGADRLVFWVWSDSTVARMMTCPSCGTDFVEVPRPHDGRLAALMDCDCFEGSARRKMELEATLMRMRMAARGR